MWRCGSSVVGGGGSCWLEMVRLKVGMVWLTGGMWCGSLVVDVVAHRLEMWWLINWRCGGSLVGSALSKK